MNVGQLLSRFSGQWKLLVLSLSSGVSGAHRALEVFRRQQRANPERSLSDFIETLCRDEVTCPGKNGQTLTVKPLVWLFPGLFKQNLLTFIYLSQSRLPKATILRLVQCLGQEPCPSPWVTVWKKQLERNMGSSVEEPLYSSVCAQRLAALSRQMGGETGGWSECSVVQVEETNTYLSELGAQIKRKGHFDVCNDSEQIQQQNKKLKIDENIGRQALDHYRDPLPENMMTAEKLEIDASREMPAWKNSQDPLPVQIETSEELKTQAPGKENTCDLLPEHIKVSVRQIKELLQRQTELDHFSLDVFKVLNDCNATQVEVLCCELSLSDLAEHTLLQLCSTILALSPDLSFSTAVTLIKSLLLQKVLALSEPASRCLVSAVISLGSRYTRSMCHALIEPLLEQENLGSAQVELLNKLIEGCLDSHYRLLVLQITLKISWSETLLSFIHSLLESKPDMNEELFTELIEHLISQAPLFIKSVKFAKMMLTVLTKYASLVSASQKHSLSGCLMLNETFLKKSLQAMLKRIPNT
ncbi:Fanconi anemia group E protein isoform X2 [Corythoichthys intestinalis]|uniref:Fanconi anemia group E protein isoform X2 n=1 Tax=Corythoichthys intestinalis TaxID=161448 RepID=UPI0025A65110|nr:Fanconi anemia group E protein isoform X2 [Corythoichthys intestinalis]XP_061802747.1 Fanconi anemia group E protein-like [Nerophis lumbriciformis]